MASICIYTILHAQHTLMLNLAGKTDCNGINQAATAASNIHLAHTHINARASYGVPYS